MSLDVYVYGIKVGTIGQKPEPLGARIRRLRLNACMTQKEVLRHTQLSAGFLSDVENGKRSVSAATLYSLARCLGVSMDELFTGTKD